MNAANADSHVQANASAYNSNSMADASQFAPYAMSGGRALRRRTKRTVRASPKKAKPQRKIHLGPNGGKYTLRKGRKVYLC